MWSIVRCIVLQLESLRTCCFLMHQDIINTATILSVPQTVCNVIMVFTHQPECQINTYMFQVVYCPPAFTSNDQNMCGLCSNVEYNFVLFLNCLKEDSPNICYQHNNKQTNQYRCRPIISDIGLKISGTMLRIY